MSVAVILFCLPVAAYLVSYIHAQGMAAYEAKDFGKAASLLRISSHLGNHDAQAILGAMYSMGQGVPRDSSEAVNWLEKSASAGNTTAQTMLGALYATGTGITVDHAKAQYWLTKAAQGGDAEAARILRRLNLSAGGA